MNINFTPAMRKTVLGGMAALAVTGGALTACNPTKTEEKTSVEITQQDIDDYYEALSNAQQAYLNACKQEQTDSLNYVKNPTRENDFKYLNSKAITRLQKSFLETVESPESRALRRSIIESLIPDSVLYNEIVNSMQQ